MARGGVKGFGDLVGSVGDESPIDGRSQAEARAMRTALTRTAGLKELSANPHNPRESIGDLNELASIIEFQLQPVVVVTQPAFRRLYPETEVSTKWVVVLGNRRLAAAQKFGRPELDILVRDDLAKDRATLLSAVIAENVDRSGFDVIEEAQAVESLVQERGSADAAAEQLRKSKTWVSQRRALLKLAPELREATRRGDLAIREARALARVPLEEQVARWNATRDRHENKSDTPDGAQKPSAQSDTGGSGLRGVTRALRRFDREPDALAGALHHHLGPDGARDLASRLHALLG
ncbi:ParB/RepB/Spo0J family partition protein [Mycolicibacterium frederiksbergense]